MEEARKQASAGCNFWHANGRALETAATGAWLASGLPRVSSTRERDSCDVLGFGKALTHWSYCRIFFVDHIV